MTVNTSIGDAIPSPVTSRNEPARLAGQSSTRATPGSTEHRIGIGRIVLWEAGWEAAADQTQAATPAR